MPQFLASIAALLAVAIPICAVFLYGTIGEIITEKVGHLNLGIPGIICFGGIGGCFGISICYHLSSGIPNPVIVFIVAVLFAMLFGGFLGLIYSFFTVTLRANQNITGLTITTFGAGLAQVVSVLFDKMCLVTERNSGSFQALIPKFDRIGMPTNASEWFGKAFFSYGLIVYLAFVLAIVTNFVLNYTKVGLGLRAVGENPATADAVGLNVTKYKYVATIVGAAIAGLGGLTFIMRNGIFDQASTIESFGWIAVSLVIFSVWKPSIAIAGSFTFGLLQSIPTYFTVAGRLGEALEMLPYVLTIIVLIITSIVGKKSVQPPGSLGTNYFREDR